MKKKEVKTENPKTISDVLFPKEPKNVQIKVQDQELKGFYSNLMQITHTQEEFVLDFFLVIPPQGTLASRVILSPGHLKRMIKALQDNIEKYEKKNGTIKDAQSPE